MKVTTGTVFDILSRLRVYFQGSNSFRNSDNKEPFRSELYSADQMNRHGTLLARSHKLMKRNSSDQLLKRLGNNEETLLEVQNLIVESVGSGKSITPAAEWLLDNSYLVEEQIVMARRHLPKGYSEGLPYLAEGISSGMPRIYDIALEIISHSDGRVDVKSLTNFIAAYQESTLLTLGELWAIPIMLRLAVIENLRRIAGKVALDMIDQKLAGYWAEKMMTTIKEEPGDLILIIADMVRSRPVLGSSFVAEFSRKLQGKGPSLALPISWMEEQLTGMGTSINDLVRHENQKQAADQVSVRNSISTLRVIGATDWREFVEMLSSVEEELKQDITGTYPLMDFATRDRYRHVVESISKSSDLSETEVARLAIALTRQHTGGDAAVKRYQHVGYYLIDKGLRKLEQAARVRYSLRRRLAFFTDRRPVTLYLLSILCLTLLAAAAIFYPAYRYAPHNWPLLSLVALVSLSGSTQLAVSLVNWWSTIWTTPKLLPRMDFSEDIPAAFRTLVVIPTMLAGKAYIEELIEALEIRFLANRQANIYFGLLTDLPDAAMEDMPEDDELLYLASNRILALNEKYKQAGEDIFFLFHRPRTWNAREKKWMGYERKRGKLSALNTFIRGQGRDAFSLITGNYPVLNGVKYVITLDSDTQLPRETVWKLIAAMAHPLNHALYNPQKRRITEGYGILQPRIGSAAPSTAPSLYLRMQGETAGIDPYSLASSDVYQDLFGEGSFIGKGIYDVEIFDQVLQPALQENRILSHDLLEGCYARSGLLSDVVLYEEGVLQYGADVRRHHRWIRGDWQVGAWMLPFVTNSEGRLVKNKLSGLSRWKIFDNLRRSLQPLTLLLILLAGWCFLSLPGYWTLIVIGIQLLALLAATGWQLLNKPADLTFKAHVTEIGVSISQILTRFLFNLAVLPYEAFKYTDAVIRTNWRMIISKKRLLEWAPSAIASKNDRSDIASMYRSMWIAPALGIACAGFLLFTHSAAFYVAAPILALWVLAPLLAASLSRPVMDTTVKLTDEQTSFLHRSARKTWAFFEQFVTAADNWLPPDNYQEQPVAVIAHRTSPTNMGMALLANLTAYDFGYIGGRELVQRCNNTLRSMIRLHRYKGHFYNWYDTISMSVLQPRYVSAVDSGNLAGHLLTLRQGLLQLPGHPVFGPRIYEGFRTTAGIITSLAGKHPSTQVGKIKTLLNGAITESISLGIVKMHLDELAALFEEPPPAVVPDQTAVSRWIDRLSTQVKNIRDDLALQVPWLGLLPMPSRFVHLAAIDRIPSLLDLRDISDQLLPHIKAYEQGQNTPTETKWLTDLRTALLQGSQLAKDRIALSEQLAEECEQLSDIEYDFLLNKSTGLLHIGFNVDEHRRDDSYYDLLASEIRLGIFVGIAQGKLPQESWFALGRLLTNPGKEPILLSWSGSMFEYLMPQLVMPSYDNTLLSQTSKATVRRQIEYAGQQGVPWGISESAYNMVDAELNYQYRAFGVPGLGLKRGLKEDLVIAPYATMLALMVSPSKACVNLRTLSAEGFEGEFGFYEAIDYTPGRQPRGKTHTIVQSFMVHHQGMGLLSLAYQLLDKPMQQRFVSELRFNATLLLLHERQPRATPYYVHAADLVETHGGVTEVPVRKITTPNTRTPELQLLGNGRYQVMVTNSGAGYSRWNDIAVTRWREDTTQDNRGIFCYIKDTQSGNVWSNTYQPTLHPGRNYEAVFSQGHVEFRRTDHGLDTRTEIVVSPEDDMEMRRVGITNRTQSAKILEITSYAEIVMARQDADEAHPAFSNLFVQTEVIPQYKAIFCTRRPRSANEMPPWMFHLMEVHGGLVEAVSFESDRMQFIGRGRTLAHPQAMENDQLSGSHGSVLDPIVSIRYRIHLKPGQTATIDLIYGISPAKEACENLMHKYRDQHLKHRAFELSWTHNQVLLRQINANESDAQLYLRLAASVIYANPSFRAEAAVILNNYRGQSGLWSHSVSGDLPIVLMHVYDPGSLELVRQMVQAHAYWRLKGLAVDLVIWNEDYGSYRQLLQDQIQGMITAEAAGNAGHARPGNIYVRSADQISSEDRILFESVARVIIHDNKGTLSEQVDRHHTEKALPPLIEPRPVTTKVVLEKIALPEDLLFFNGTGGFTPDGKEYKIIVEKGITTPAPWVNVIANPDFGTVISESGSAYTWAINAHEYRITPWSNDPVCDAGGEAYYLRDEETGQYWSPSPFPAMNARPYIVTHGFGYSVFEHTEQGISSELTVFVDKALPVKFIVLKVRNRSGQERKLSATGFLEMILGDVRSKTNMHIISEVDAGSGAIFVRNRYNTAFAERVTFFRTEGANQSFTADRSEFIGRNGNLKNPQSLHRKKLSGRVGAGMDPCAALQVKFDLFDGAEKDIVFQLGNGENITAVNALLREFANKEAVLRSLDEVKKYWRAVLGAVQVMTPDTALNILANGWLTYQTMACRVFARTGFYQSGGAFGFRDQLQDVLALLHTQPDLARQQILLSASRQFAEGDVQHWWHPPEGRGVRTHCSDDLLWLPFAVARYVDATGDGAILSVTAGFLESRLLQHEEDSFYDLPVSSSLSAPLYEHCVRAIRHALPRGKHGLPLIGSGDWNDGMDQVGNKGQGESVWLAFFLYDVLVRFANVAHGYGDAGFADVCKSEATALRSSIEASGWDGEWYLRAWFDDGMSLGSKDNNECRIDAIAQSWAVLSGAADGARAATAMDSLNKHLVRRDLKLIQLLDPPFEGTGLNPGYIKGYVPGVRENGGQYSHAAIWALMAFAELGQRDRTWELFQMIQPLNHAMDPLSVNVYKAEPYVMAADVYANESHKGRGGWTWYTGSAGWMYQFIVGSLLGIELRADRLRFRPCFPLEWPSVSIDYRYGGAFYKITVFQDKHPVGSWWKIDGIKGEGETVQLTDDGLQHHVEIHYSIDGWPSRKNRIGAVDALR